MNIRKNIILGFIIILLLAGTILVSLWSINSHTKNSSLIFSELIEHRNLNDLSLTIYYMNPLYLTRYPISDTDLIDGKFDYKVTIRGRRLDEHIDLLNQLNSITLIPVEHKSYLNARLCYVFETKKDGKILTVSMWGKNNSIFVNGCEVKENNVFYDVVMPFLPEDAIKELQTYITNGI